MSSFEPVYDVYLSGPISAPTQRGVRENIDRFHHEARRLREMGLRVFCPPEGEPDHLEWGDYLRRDLKYLLDSASVAVLPGWEGSTGAQLEVHVAHALGMQVDPIHVYVYQKTGA